MFSVHKYDLCRLCLCGSYDLMDIFEDNAKFEFIVEESIEDLLQIHVDKELGLPWLICSTCFGKLREFRIFKIRCRECKDAFDNRFRKKKGQSDNDWSDTLQNEMIECNSVTTIGGIKEEIIDTASYEEEKQIKFNESCSTSFANDIQSTNCTETPRPDGDSDELVLIKEEPISEDHVIKEDETFVCSGTPVSGSSAVAEESSLSRPKPQEPLVEVTTWDGVDCGGGTEVFEGGFNVVTERITVEEKPKPKTGYSQCTICGKYLTTRRNLKKHLEVHFGSKDFECEICFKRFHRKEQLKCHSLVHTGVRDFECHICGQRFLRSGNLKIHQKVHTGEKPYQCEICLKSFSHMFNLRIHASQHSEDKSFVCKVCGTAFGHKSLLCKHSKIHRGLDTFICDICSRVFRDKESLKAHIMTHPQYKSVHCPVCSKKFGSLSSLKSHLRCHAGEKPYKCSICERGYGWLATLRQHMNTVHGRRK